MERLLDRAAAAFGARPRRNPPAQSHPAGADALSPRRCTARRRHAGRMTAAIIRMPAPRAGGAPAGPSFRRARQRRARDGRLIGIGLANYVEGTGRGPFEARRSRIGPSGKIVVTTGATAQGPGRQDHAGADRRRACSASTRAIFTSIDRRHRREPARARRLREPAGGDGRQCGPRAPPQSVADKIKQARAVLLEVARRAISNSRAAPCGSKACRACKRASREIARALGGVPGFALPGGLPPGLAAPRSISSRRP